MTGMVCNTVLTRSGGAAQQADEADEALGGTVAGMELPPRAPAGQMGGGTASQLIRGVRRTRGVREHRDGIPHGMEER
jgi:hypothetical protein